MTSVTIIVDQWADLKNPFGVSFGRKSGDSVWDYTALKFVASKDATNAVKPLAQATGALWRSRFTADVPADVAAVQNDVLMFFHAPAATGFGVASYSASLVNDSAAPAFPVIRPVVVTTTVQS